MKSEKSYIISLYSGEIQPLDKLVPKTQGYRQTETEMDSILEKLKPAVDEKVLEAVTTLLELASTQCSEYGEICFELGFKHGMRLMAEATPSPRDDSILEQLYKGDIHPAENTPRSEEYWRYSKEFNKLQDEFMAALDDEQRQKYATLKEVRYAWQSVNDQETYLAGLRDGAKILSALK